MTIFHSYVSHYQRVNLIWRGLFNLEASSLFVFSRPFSDGYVTLKVTAFFSGWSRAPHYHSHETWLIANPQSKDTWTHSCPFDFAGSDCTLPKTAIISSDVSTIVCFTWRLLLLLLLLVMVVIVGCWLLSLSLLPNHVWSPSNSCQSPILLVALYKNDIHSNPIVYPLVTVYITMENHHL